MEPVTEFTGHVGIIYSLQVLDGSNPGGARLFSACYDKTLRVSCETRTSILCTCTVMYVRFVHKGQHTCTSAYVCICLRDVPTLVDSGPPKPQLSHLNHSK